MVFANRGIMASEKAYVGTRTSNLSDKWKDDTPSVGYVEELFNFVILEQIINAFLFSAMIAYMYLDTILYAFLAWCILFTNQHKKASYISFFYYVKIVILK